MSPPAPVAEGVPDRADPVLAGLLARCTFPPGPLDLAVSGGPDSTALLALAVAHGARVVAHHVDHGLRPGSDEEADVVAGLCRRWGAGFRSHTATVADGGDLESRCRAARRAVLPPGCLTGHTADDQAETVLLRLLRGTGPVGLSAMSPDTHPLLALRRADTVALCAHLGVTPLRDPTNDWPRFTRNRVRHEVLPLLSEVAGRDVVPLLARTAELAAGQSRVVAALAAGIDPLDAARVAGSPPPVAAAALRGLWHERTGGLPPPDRAAVDRMLEVASGSRRACDVARGWRLSRSRGRLRLSAPPSDTRSVGR